MWLIAGLMVLALAPGLIAGDRPFQTSLCGDFDGVPEACAHLGREGMHEVEAELGEPALAAP